MEAGKLEIESVPFELGDLVDDVTSLVSALDDATVSGSVRVIVAKVGARADEAVLLRDIQADVSAALLDLTDETAADPGSADDDEDSDG